MDLGHEDEAGDDSFLWDKHGQLILLKSVVGIWVVVVELMIEDWETGMSWEGLVMAGGSWLSLWRQRGQQRRELGRRRKEGSCFLQWAMSVSGDACE
jgi:hypothetical protein